MTAPAQALLCVFIGWLACFAPALAQTAAPTDRLIVRYAKTATQFHQGKTAAERSAIASAWTGEALALHRAMSGERTDVYRLPSRRALAEVEAIARRLAEHPDVEFAEPDRVSRVQLPAPNDPEFANQWALQPGSSGGMNVAAAWDIDTGSPAMVIALLDTGILPHPDLPQSRVLAGYDFVDPGRANDGGGRDASASDPGDWVSAEEAQPGGAYAGCPVQDSSWHGTAMAGAILAAANNATGIAGINWQSKLLPLRVAGKCGAYDADVIDAMRWAAGIAVNGVPANANPARVINISLSTEGACGAAYQSAINEVTYLGATVVVAAGNAGRNAGLYSPASCSGVITVGAVDKNGALPAYANTGTEVSLSAPGGSALQGILALSDGGTTVPANDGAVKSVYGTSIATAQVTGVVSLMLSANASLEPPEVKRLLQVTARGYPAAASAGCSPTLCGAGIVDAYWAVSAAKPFAHTTPRIAGDLALKDDGTVWAIGGAQVSGVSAAKAVAKGAAHQLALKSDGTVWAWGGNASGQLGDGTLADRATPAPVAGLTGVVQVAAGTAHSLALKSDGTVWAWGLWGEENRTAPVQVGGLSQMKAIRAVGDYSVALKTNGSLWTFDANSAIQPVMLFGLLDVALDAAGNVLALKSDGTLWSAGGEGSALSGVSAVGSAGGRLYALKSDGSVWGWGDNSVGLLCDGTLTTPASAVKMLGASNAIALAGTASATTVLRSDGSLSSCRSGELAARAVANFSLGVFDPTGFQTRFDQVPNATVESNTVTVTGIASGSAIAVTGGEYRIGGGAYTSLPGVIDNGQSVTVRLASGGYGQSSQVQLAINGVVRSFSIETAAADAVPDRIVFAPQAGVAPGAVVESNVATVAGINGAVSVSVSGGEYRINGGAYTAAPGSVSAGDTLQVRVTAGAANELRQALLAVGESSASFFVAAANDGSYRVRPQIAGDLALKDDGTVWATGGAQVAGIGGAKSIARGGSHRLAALADGSVWAWGSNGNGQLGDGTLADRTTPLPVAGLAGVVQVAAGSAHSLALTSDGAVWAWGAWGSQNLTAPVKVNELGAMKLIRTSYEGGTSVGLKTDGTVWTFDAGSVLSPAFGSGYVDVAIDAFGNALALKSDGTLWSSSGWGSTLANVVALGSARAQLYAIRSDGGVRGWGDNAGGLLCDGTFEEPMDPVAMQGVANAVALGASAAGVYVLQSDGSVRACRTGDMSAQAVANFNLGVFDPTGFQAKLDQWPGVWIESNSVNLVGIANGSAISITGGEYRIGSGAFTAQAGLINNGQAVTVRVMSGTYGETKQAQLAIGGVTRTFSVTTAALDAMPDPIYFAVQANVAAGAVVESVAATVAGINSPVAVSVAGGEYRIGSGAYTSAQGTVNAGEAIQVRASAGAANDLTKVALTVGQSSSAFYVESANDGAFAVTARIAGDLALKDDGTVWRIGGARVEGVGGAKAIAKGGAHQLALHKDGTVWAWGANANGQLGDGTLMERATPVPVNELTGVIAVAAGNAHSLALTSDGKVWGWGLWGGVTRTAPVQVSGLSQITAIRSAGDYSVALKADGSLWTFDANSAIQPVMLFGLLDAAVDEAGSVLALKSDGTLWSAGGEGSSLSGVSAVGSAGSRLYALKSDGSVWGWGDNSVGLLCDGMLATPESAVKMLGAASAIAASGTASATYVLRSDGSVESCQPGQFAALGIANFTLVDDDVTPEPFGFAARFGVGRDSWVESSPVVMTGLGVPAAISISGGDYSVNGGAYTSAAGQIANGDVLAVRVQSSANYSSAATARVTVGTYSTRFQAVTAAAPEESAVSPMVAAGNANTLVLRRDGTVLAFGYNGNGQLGNGGFLNRSTPAMVAGLAGVKFLAAGSYHALAAKNDGSVWSWGWNGSGQVGDAGSDNAKREVFEVPGLSDVKAVAAGYAHSLALKEDGTVWAWGLNADGQLGDGGSARTRAAPAQVPGLAGIVAIAAGERHSLALDLNGNLFAWGANDQGQLGEGGTRRRSLTPVAVPLTGITAIAAGARHTLAIRSDGSLWAWGENSKGQLGDGSRTARSSPIAVPRLRKGVTRIGAGNAHSLAAASGALYAWGRNNNGELGDGTNQERGEPVLVPNGRDIVGLAAGNRHSVALKSDGTLLVWGDNTYGQVGNRDGNYDPEALAADQLRGDGAIVARTQVNTSAEAPPNTDGASNAFATEDFVDAIRFGEISLGNSVQKIVPLATTYLSAWTGMVFEIVGSGFSQSNDCSGGLSASGYCTVTASFTPPQPGEASGELRIKGNRGKGVETVTRFALSGFGLGTTTTQPPIGQPSPVDLMLGWNLIGNGNDAPVDVALALGDPSNVTTAWKWIAESGKWAFYAPTLGSEDLIAYAASKGYDVLSAVNGGEGFWVNAKEPFTLQLPGGSAVAAASFQSKLIQGWNLVSIGEDKTPGEFNAALSGLDSAPSNPEEIPINLTTLWTWDSTNSGWYFYAPILEKKGSLSSYIQSKSYLDFNAAGKKLGTGVGFWVNKP